MKDEALFEDAFGSQINATVVCVFDKKFGDIETPRAFHPQYNIIREKIYIFVRGLWDAADLGAGKTDFDRKLTEFTESL